MLHFKASRRLFFISAICLTVLAACGLNKTTNTGADQTGHTSVMEAETQGTLTSQHTVVTGSRTGIPEDAMVSVRTLGTIHNLNPQKAGLSSEEEFARYLFGSLYMLQADPAKESPEYTPFHAGVVPEILNERVFRIPLRPGLTWSDGTPLLAEDYVYSLKALLDPEQKNPAAQRLLSALNINNAAEYERGVISDFSLVGFRAEGETVLELTLSEPASPLDVMAALSMPFLVEPELHAKRPGKYGKDFRALSYAGPYELAEYKQDDHALLKKRNDEALKEYESKYFRFDYISLYRPENRSQAMDDFMAGKLDLLSVSGPELSRVQEDTRLVKNQSNSVWGLYVNTSESASSMLRDKNFRKALYYGIDRTELAVNLFGSYGSYSGFIGPLTRVESDLAGLVLGDLPVYRQTTAGNQSVPKANVFNLELAGSFAQAAVSNGAVPQTIELTVPDGFPQYEEMAAYLKYQVERIFDNYWVTLKIRKLPIDEAYTAYRSGNYELGFGGMGQELNDPRTTLALYVSDHPDKLNTFQDSRYDELFRNNIGFHGADRITSIKEMEDMLLEELPMIPLFSDHNAWLIQPWLKLPSSQSNPGAGLCIDMAEFTGSP